MPLTLKYKLFFTVFLISIIATIGYSQSYCGFDIMHKKLTANNSRYAEKVEQNKLLLRQKIQNRASSNATSSFSGTIDIPVVVHIMHTGGAVGSIYNPTDATIINTINYLNQVYDGTYPGMTAPSPGGAVGNMQVRFVLATTAPDCSPASGIERINASTLSGYVSNGVNVINSNGANELDVKNLSRWNPRDYYNIWVVNKIDGNDGTSGQYVAGYAYFPGAPVEYDGAVMLATTMIAGGKTLPHELGHAFNLEHPFNGSDDASQCPVNTDCLLDGDYVCDTDPISNNVTNGIYNFSCRTGTNPCTGTPYTDNTESNFMSYTNCYTLFTNGQADRFHAAMTLPDRASLMSSANPALQGLEDSVEVVIVNQSGGWTYYGFPNSAPTKYVFGIEKNPTGTGGNTNAISVKVIIKRKYCFGNNYEAWYKTSGQEGIFAAGISYNTYVTSTQKPNGFVNIRWMDVDGFLTRLQNAADYFVSLQGSSYASSLLCLKKINSAMLLPQNLRDDALGLYYGVEPLEYTGSGTVDGNNYIEFTNVNRIAGTGQGVFIRATSLPANASQYQVPAPDPLRKGALRFNSITTTFEGYDGNCWQPLH